MVDKVLELNYSDYNIPQSGNCRSGKCNMYVVVICKDHYQSGSVQCEYSSDDCCWMATWLPGTLKDWRCTSFVTIFSCVQYGSSHTNLLLAFDLMVKMNHVKFCIGTQKHTNTALNIILSVDNYKHSKHAIEVMCDKSDLVETWTSVNYAYKWITNYAVISL
jgi:hypothetical protein